MGRTIVVVGGALAGPTAAARARELDDAARIVLVERNVRVSYAVGALAYHLSGEVPAMDSLDREDRGFFEAFYRVEVKKQTEAVAIDPAARNVTLRSGGKEDALRYDTLVYAPGAETIRPTTVVGDNVRPLRTLPDLEAIAAAIDAGARRFLILGGGSFGLEAADGLVRRGAEVTLVSQSLLPRFGEQITALAHRALSARVDVRLGVTVTGCSATNGRVTKVTLSDGSVIDTDWVVLSTGVKPRTSLLAAAGIALHPDGGAVIDERTRTSAEGIFACGSCASVPEAITGKAVWWPQAAIADKTAQVAGANAAGGDERIHPFVGSMLIRVLDLTVGRVGLSADEAPNAARTIVHAASHDSFFPGASPMTLEILWDRASGRVLGVEAAGVNGVETRIDTAACAVAAGMTLEQLARLDLGYAPPYAAARDPLNVVATAASAERAGLGRSISARDVRGGQYQLVDVRSDPNARDAIAGAKRIPITELRDRLGELDPGLPTVAFSGTGRHGWLAVRILAQHGFRETFNLAGGLAAWERS